MANDRGLLPRLRHVEALDELQHFTVEERVDYSIEHFAHATGALQPSLWDTAEARKRPLPTNQSDEGTTQ